MCAGDGYMMIFPYHETSKINKWILASFLVSFIDELCKLGNIVTYEIVERNFRVHRGSTKQEKLRPEECHSTCVAFSSNVQVMVLELREPLEPVQEKGVGVLGCGSIAELLQI